MKAVKVLISSILAVLLLIVIIPKTAALSFNDGGHPKALARAIAMEMSDEQALAQTFMLGWVGAEPSPLILNWIKDRNIGGVKIFGWNTGDTRRLAETVGNLQENALDTRFNIPLLVATDQEGGLVRHVKGTTSETPGNMAIGASGRPMDAYWSGFYIGKELSILGINMNFAPAVDLYTNRDSTLIGPRSFGTDPVQAGILGAAFVRGLATQGVIATAKHYPGHGDTDLDSHGVLPRIDASFELLWERELIPYRLLAKEKLPAVMTGHLSFPKTQAGDTPASLSSWFIRDILKEKIGYQGLIITDDLMMNGATNFAGSLSRAAKQALMAGNDIIMLSKTPSLNDQVWTYLLAAMKDEADFRARVRDAAQRILETKLEYLRGDKKIAYIPDLKKVDEGLPDPEGAAFFLDLAARSATIVKGRETIFPLDDKKAGKVLLAGQYQDFFNAGKKAYPNAVSYWYSSWSSPDLLYYARNADTIIFCLSDQGGLNVLRSLKGMEKKIVVFSVLSPVYLDEASWADGAVAVYSYAPESFIAGFSAMLGRIGAAGQLPFPLNEPLKAVTEN
ncbi:glycoside hydrolase family 3 protein [Leadbettera azotonutricia]|uniref:beta-N-acetylhexosaminidase n=1 Tax=Leadbettera azotonutricia (strain ATCC BAA-888 / DSM 13862 / ZAS-9) TaxID=545695 RepID=F5YGD9_LEAAZ|nr:glycoside hydrolase family 3 protein [Leadbettera azotonutricia]AEF81081.1 glycosyl hydrolase, family 3 [Leadbettera azotonutricia ZAS-9]